MGYHLEKIEKGVLGEPSKIAEEVAELADAMKQGNRILAMVELSDVYGALELVAERLGTNMAEVAMMAAATRRAFEDGDR